MTRAEHVAWCKQRAYEYLDRGDLRNAVSSMLSDMRKHPECRVHPPLALIGMLAVADQNASEVRRFIDGFN